LKFRQSEEAFSPEFPSRVLESGEQIFAFIRGPDSRGREIVCVHNFSCENSRIDLSPSGISGLGEMPVKGRGLLWIALGGKKKIRELTL
jgi:hypothetical protein